MKHKQNWNVLITLLTLLFVMACSQQGKIKNKKSVITDEFSSLNFEPLIASNLYIVKEKCECGGLEGLRYRIIYDSITNAADTYCHYSYDPVIRAADSLKIPIMKALLELKNGIDLCCKSVKRYGSNHAKTPPESTTYNLQIDALYTVNIIAFGSFIKSYCPYPVLYDTITMKEINNDPSKIKEVFEIYREWFKEAKAMNFMNYEFPLVKTRYRWYGGKTDRLILRCLPDHPLVSGLGRAYLDL